jgi:aspartate/methionine/tyrosine aminotransferase
MIFFSSYSDYFSWVRPKAGCVGLVKTHGLGDMTSFAKQLLEETGLLIMPGNVCSVDDSYFRIGFGRENMPESLKILKGFLLAGYRITASQRTEMHTT